MEGKKTSDNETNLDYWNYCVDRANDAETDKLAMFFTLSTISKSLANIADALDEINEKLEDNKE